MSKPNATSKQLAIDQIHCMDAIAGLRRLDDESIDLVITDPPYNVAGKNKTTIRHGRVMSTMEAWGQWDCLHPFDHDILLMQVISECYRVLKPGGAFYMFTSRQDNGYFIRKAIARGFTYRNQLAMVKTTAVPSFFKNSWRSCFELCMYLTKGRQGTFNFPEQREARNVHEWSIRTKSTTHPTEKPLDFIKKLVRISSNPGDLVLDPFMGSGTTAAAAKEQGRHFIGFELNSEYIDIAKTRLKGGRAAGSKAKQMNG